LKIPKKKPIKSIRIKTHLNISIMYPLGTKEKENHSIRTFENNV
jgi:hypothetical protein